jgi:hypothetical protein
LNWEKYCCGLGEFLGSDIFLVGFQKGGGKKGGMLEIQFLWVDSKN